MKVENSKYFHVLYEYTIDVDVEKFDRHVCCEIYWAYMGL